jgi:hypothetical protein
MKLNLRTALTALALCAAVFFSASISSAATIIKLNLGSVGPDITMNGAGILSTASDGIGTTTGDQNTDIEFTGFLDGPNPDITTTDASFSLAGLATSGPATTFGSLVIQPFLGGTFSLYNSANTLLLQGPLTSSALTGVLGPPGGGTGSLFTTTLGNVTGGSLLPLLLPGSVTLSMNLSNVSGGAGFSLPPGNGAIAPFVADASANIGADPIPEPTSALLLIFGLVAAAGVAKRGRR